MTGLIRGWLMACLCLTLTGCNSDANRNNLTHTPDSAERGEHPLVSAHRGGAAHAPENTLLAMQNALRLGVDQLEADAQLTADGVVVLIHDDTLDRTTDCSGPVNAVALNDLLDCDAAYWFSPGQSVTQPDESRAHPLRGQGIGIPTAEELLALLATLGEDAPELSIEIKDVPGESNFDPIGNTIAQVLVPLIQQYGLQEKVIVQSFWPTVLDFVKLMDSSIRTQFLTTTDIGILATINLLYSTLRMHDILAPNFDAPDFNASYVQLAQTAGKQVIPYTVDHPEDMQRISALGVDGLITNYPACLLALQGRRGSGPATPMGVSPVPDCPD